MYSIIHKKGFTLPFQCICCLLLLIFLLSCGRSQLKKSAAGEVLQVTGFRLLDNPQVLVQWQYNYPNRAFNLPSYRTLQGIPLPGWRYQVVTTRRFFTDQSARIYYRIEDLYRGYIFSPASTTAAETMRIWPVGATLVLETYSGGGANTTKESPLFVDCIRKFEVDVRHFPEDTLFDGEWSYQRFDVEGKPLAMPEGATACQQCHGAALRLTGDLVFTVISKDWDENKTSHSLIESN